jgi:hypothetical protein
MTTSPESKRTPGPWAVNEGNAWICTVGNNTSDPAVFCNRPIKAGEPYPFGDKWADAHLIAAAPDMATAIEQATDFLAGHFYDTDNGEWENHEAHEVFVRLMAVRAKAEGR